MISFKVRTWDVNSREVEYYDVMPYFYGCWENQPYIYDDKGNKSKPSTLEEFKRWFAANGRWQYWARCEYELCCVGFPCADTYEGLSKEMEKTDVWDVIEANLDLIAGLMWEDVSK